MNAHKLSLLTVFLAACAFAPMACNPAVVVIPDAPDIVDPEPGRDPVAALPLSLFLSSDRTTLIRDDQNAGFVTVRAAATREVTYKWTVRSVAKAEDTEFEQSVDKWEAFARPGGPTCTVVGSADEACCLQDNTDREDPKCAAGQLQPLGQLDLDFSKADVTGTSSELVIRGVKNDPGITGTRVVLEVTATESRIDTDGNEVLNEQMSSQMLLIVRPAAPLTLVNRGLSDSSIQPGDTVSLEVRVTGGAVLGDKDECETKSADEFEPDNNGTEYCVFWSLDGVQPAQRLSAELLERQDGEIKAVVTYVAPKDATVRKTAVD